MSAIRTNKADARSGRFIAPYTRWFSRILGVRSSDDSEELVKSSTSTEDSTSGSRLSTSHALTSEPQKSNLESKQPPHLPPALYSTTPKIVSSASPPDVVMDNVASFLSHSAGQSVSAEEVEGMLAMLRANSTPEPREIFRFSSTPTRDLQSSPSTPLTTRKKLPRNPNGVYRWEGAGSAKHARSSNRYASPAFGASPSKQNRSAVNEGIDSQDTLLPDSKRRRVGDESSSSSVPTQRPFVSEPTARKLPFPSITSPTLGTNGVGSRSNPLPSPSRLRTPVKPTSPVVPSPLRQAWSETSSTFSQNGTRKSPPQTKTANFMAELIKETTPPKKPDLANPYQLASPVGKVGPPRRSTKRPRATGRPVVFKKAENEEEKGKKEEPEEKEKLKEYSPQTIIEATVPKGSQRSRPPAHFEKPTDTPITEEESSCESPRPQCEAPAVETSKIPYVVEEVDDDEAEEARRSAKRTKLSINGLSPTPTAAEKPQMVASEPEITIDILEDIDMDAAEHKEKTKEQPKLIIPIIENGSSPSGTSTSPTNVSPTASRNRLSSVPKEPSKLRFSFQPEATSVPSTPALKPAVPSPPSLPKSDFKFETPSSNFNFSFKSTDVSPVGSPKPQEQAKKVKVKDTNVEDIKAKARTMTPSSLPSFVMTSSATSVLPSSVVVARMQRRVNDLPVSSLPNFELSSGPSKSATPFSFGFDPANPKQKKPFTFGPSSSSPPKIVGNNSSPQSSGIFGVNSPSTPPVLEATVMKRYIAPVIKGFDFAAAGMKAPSNNPGTWICSLCALSNPSSALKCEICDIPATSTSSSSTAAAAPPPAPSPALAPPAVPPIKAFDFAAAGMKAPSNNPGTWICSLCALSNPSSALKCEICDTPAIGTPSSAAAAPPLAPSPVLAPPAVPAIKAFDFAAAGMKAPSVTSDTWICSLCALTNPMSANQCVACETTRVSFS